MSAETEPFLEMVDTDIAAFRNARALVLGHVHWRVLAGEFWVVAGLHVSGKTDLLATAAGILPPGRGICRLFGHDTQLWNERELEWVRLRLGMVFDGGRLLQNLTLQENVMLPLRYHRNLTPSQAREQVQPLLELTDLVQWAHAAPEVVGRNWQQRAGLARALVLKPDLLLLDNPLSGLDPKDLSWWIQLLHELAGGHPILDRKPLTIVVTDNSFGAWRGQPYRFALLRDQRLHVLERLPGPDALPPLAHEEAALMGQAAAGVNPPPPG